LIGVLQGALMEGARANIAEQQLEVLQQLLGELEAAGFEVHQPSSCHRRRFHKNHR
jgi:hypothetical protein